MNYERYSDTVKLDEEEKDLLDSFERGEWKTIDNFDVLAAEAKQAAINYLSEE